MYCKSVASYRAALRHEGDGEVKLQSDDVIETARSVEERSVRVIFSREEAEKIISALNQSVEPNEALRQAMRMAERIEANSTE